MTVSTSPNQFVDPPEVLDCLNLPGEEACSPMIFACPLCGGARLEIYRDWHFGGGWHFCRNCGIAGDMIELAAKTWNTEILAAILRLENEGCSFTRRVTRSEVVSQYCHDHIERRNRLRQLWEKASRKLTMNSRESIWLWPLAGIYLRGSDHARRLRRFLGLTDVVDAARAFQPHVQNQSEALSGSSRIFQGRGWRNLVAIPFQDLPGRICGFLFVGREGKPEDIVYRSILTSRYTSSHRAGRTIDSGLCMLDALHPTWLSRHFGRDAFVFDDPLVAIRMQSKHLRFCERPVPLAGAYLAPLPQTPRGYVRQLAPTRTFWSQHDRDFIFWGKSCRAELISMAARAYGRLFVGPLPTEPAGAAVALLEQVRQRAVPWTEVLERTIHTSAEPARSELLSQLDLKEEAIVHFLDGCSASTKAILRDCEPFAEWLTTAKINGRNVVETPEGWFWQQTDEQISDAVLRIEKIINRPDEEKPLCEGHIVRPGESVPFQVPLRRVLWSTFRWMNATLLAHKKPPLEFLHHWSQHAYNIALQLHPPEICHSDQKCGWDLQSGRFVFPKFTIEVGGEVTEKEFPVFDKLTPATGFRPPRGLDPRAIEALTEDTPANRIFWAVAACMAANAMALYYNAWDVAGTGLVGAGAQAIGLLAAKALGCAEMTVRSRGRLWAVLDLVEEAVKKHDWPLVVHFSRSVRRENLPFCAVPASKEQAIFDLDPFLADAVGMSFRWNLVCCDAPLSEAEAIVEHGPAILPHWLRDRCRRKQPPAYRNRAMARWALEDLAEWIGPRGDADVVRDAISVLDPVEESGMDGPRRLVRLLQRAIDQGEVAFQHGGFEDPRVTVSLYHLRPPGGTAGIFVPGDVLDRLFQRERIDGPDVRMLKRRFAETGVVEFGQRYGGRPGWLIREDFWKRQVNRYRREKKWQAEGGRHRRRRPAAAA